MFARLRARREGAFVPFFMLGDPDLDTGARLLRAAIRAGADALEVGIPFSDPIADGPTLQRAGLRATAAGATLSRCFEMLAALRRESEVPIGLLTYANLVVGGGRESFYARAAAAGLDSVLVADVPILEAEPFARAARACGVAPILLAPPNLPADRLPRIAALSAGYTYVVARKGVTGATADRGASRASSFASLRAAGAPPPLMGFGISTPEHVRAAIEDGADGAICGSAIARIIEDAGPDRPAAIEAVAAFVGAMKRATTRGGESRKD
jgi:tryptophan synthase alpha chain